jgi:S1-C subfamily serine protease
MQLQWACPTCGSLLRADSGLSLRRIRCPKCRTETIVPKPESARPPASPPLRRAPSAEPTIDPTDSPNDDPLGDAPAGSDLSGGEWLAPEAPAEPDWLSGAGLASPAGAARGPLPGASAIRRATPRKKRNNMPLWITLGSIAACLVIAGIFWASGAFESALTIAVREAEQPAGLPKLVFDWPATDRSGAIVEIDGTTYRVHDKGALEYELPPGQHKIVLRRLGFARIDLTFAPQKNGERKLFKPEWKPAMPGDQNDAVSGQVVAAPSAGSGPDKLEIESLPVFKQWETDFDKAQQLAAHDKKDILIAFFSAERRDWCLSLAQQLLTTKEFTKIADEHFVLVLEEAAGKVAPEGSGMAQLAAKYRVTSYPTLILADAEGQPYARREYISLQPDGYLDMINRHLADHAERDQLFAASEHGDDAETLAAARKAFDWLLQKNLAAFYLPKIHDWSRLANHVDPKNEQGLSERFLMDELNLRLSLADKSNPQQLRAVTDLLEQWKKDCKFKDPDDAARLHLKFAALYAKAKDPEDAARYLQEAIDSHPTDPELKAYLNELSEVVGGPVSSGSGFICATGGYILTNNHVVAGQGKIWVRIAGQEKEAQAEVMAADEKRDIALIHLLENAGAKLKPLLISPVALGRGAAVSAFGFPLGDELGGGLKLTTGVISALPNKESDEMYLLNCEVNPGNSGGPLCDLRGQVVGIVSAKSFASKGVESYGMALPAEVAIEYLKANLPGYKPPAPVAAAAKLDGWDKVDQLVSPSVLMIIKRMR